MRNLLDADIDKYRLRDPRVLELYGSFGDETGGAFRVPSPMDRAEMHVIASSEGDWDHVSVSRRNRTPNWIEMEHVKRLFFRPNECAMQLHVPEDDHISNHPHTLHIWRPQRVEIPLPPKIFV